MASYTYYARTADTGHGCPYLVFDCQGELHLPLSVFTKEANERLAPSSVKKYLTGILPWFTWLDTDPWQVRAKRRWDDPPETVRNVIREYLVSKLQCRMRSRRDGGEWVATTEESINHVRILLAGLRLFYRIAHLNGYYPHTNPLVGSFEDHVESALTQLPDGRERPRMPAISGVDEPRRTKRLTDSYFLLKDTWIPQVVTDTTLPQRILDGGRLLKAQGKDWGLREECLVCLLFETGARVSEIMALTLGDWYHRGLKDTAWARNKGSRKQRAKFVRFSAETTKLLRRYIDTERVTVDDQHRTLNDYLRLAERKELDLDTIPLFLSKRGTFWSVESFRTHYWKRACEAAKIDVDIHQARHWYVTQALVVIHEQARKGTTTVERGLEELIAYMHWRAGEQVLKAYNHFYQPAHHVTVQKSVFKKLQRQEREVSPTRQPQQGSIYPLSPEMNTRVEGASEQQESVALYHFLIGTGGYADDIIVTE